MRSALLVRLGVMAAAGVLVVGPASPAWADSEININEGNVPTTAAAFPNKDCDPNFGGGPFPDQDVWVFVLPQPKQNGNFVSVTADFGANGTLTIPDDGGAIVNDKGTSKAWIRTPAGWTLEDASAVITGNVNPQTAFFNLTHVCPAGFKPPTQTPKPTGPETGGGGGQAAGSVALGVGAVAVAGVAGLFLTLSRRRRRGA